MQAALGAVGVLAQAGDQQRLQLVARERLSVIVGDRLHHPAAHVNGGAVRRVIRLRPGMHGDGLRASLVGAQRRCLAARPRRVSCLAQFVGDQIDGQLLPRAHLARRRINLRGIGKQRLLASRSSTMPRVLDSSRSSKTQKHTSCNQRDRQPQRAAAADGPRRLPVPASANLIFNAIDLNSS